VGALTALVNNYCPVVMHLEQIGNGKGDHCQTKYHLNSTYLESPERNERSSTTF
jgi:hypothetical protein